MIYFSLLERIKPNNTVNKKEPQAAFPDLTSLSDGSFDGDDGA